MTPSEWTVGLLSFLGAGIGASLSYLAAVRGSQQREGQSRREEWGRRFTAALADLGDPDPRRRQLGQVLLGRLATSGLASDEERVLADELLEEAALFPSHGQDLRLLGESMDLDEITFIEETGDGPPEPEEGLP